MEPILDLHDCLHLCSVSFTLHLENILIFGDVLLVEFMYLYLLTCQVRVNLGSSGGCIYVMSFKCISVFFVGLENIPALQGRNK